MATAYDALPGNKLLESARNLPPGWQAGDHGARQSGRTTAAPPDKNPMSGDEAGLAKAKANEMLEAEDDPAEQVNDDFSDASSAEDDNSAEEMMANDETGAASVEEDDEEAPAAAAGGGGSSSPTAEPDKRKRRGSADQQRGSSQPEARRHRRATESAEPAEAGWACKIVFGFGVDGKKFTSRDIAVQLHGLELSDESFQESSLLLKDMDDGWMWAGGFTPFVLNYNDDKDHTNNFVLAFRKSLRQNGLDTNDEASPGYIPEGVRVRWFHVPAGATIGSSTLAYFNTNDPSAIGRIFAEHKEKFLDTIHLGIQIATAPAAPKVDDTPNEQGWPKGGVVASRIYVGMAQIESNGTVEYTATNPADHLVLLKKADMPTAREFKDDEKAAVKKQITCIHLAALRAGLKIPGLAVARDVPVAGEHADFCRRCSFDTDRSLSLTVAAARSIRAHWLRPRRKACGGLA